jgi:carboxypeptidase Taq
VLDEGGVITRLKNDLDAKKLSPKDAALVREVLKDYENAKKLPESFVREYSEVTSKAQLVWREAREKDDFKLFAPHLERMFEYARKEAQLLDPNKNPYDVLLDKFEPGMTSERLLYCV